MSQTVLEDFDAFGGESGPPVPSWDTLGVGGEITGIILPQEHPVSGLLVSYLTTQQTSMATDEKPSELLWFDNDQDGPSYHTRPRTQAEYHVQTDVRDFADCSENRKELAEKNDEEDTGLRRVIVKGKTGSDSMKKAARVTFGKEARPVVGAYITYRLLNKKKIQGSQFKENITQVEFSAPDSASLAVVQRYVEENFPEHAFGKGQVKSDAFAEGPAPAASNDDQPDF